MQRKKWIYAAAAIVFVMAAYFVLGFVRGVSCYNRGSAHLAKGEYDQAIACFDKAIRIEPGFAQAYCNRGTAYYEKKQYDPAIRDFDKAIEINPDFAEAYSNRAVAHYHRKEYNEAQQDVQKAQSLGHQVSPAFLKALRSVSAESER